MRFGGSTVVPSRQCLYFLAGYYICFFLLLCRIILLPTCNWSWAVSSQSKAFTINFHWVVFLAYLAYSWSLRETKGSHWSLLVRRITLWIGNVCVIPRSTIFIINSLMLLILNNLVVSGCDLLTDCFNISWVVLSVASSSKRSSMKTLSSGWNIQVPHTCCLKACRRACIFYKSFKRAYQF